MKINLTYTLNRSIDFVIFLSLQRFDQESSYENQRYFYLHNEEVYFVIFLSLQRFDREYYSFVVWVSITQLELDLHLEQGAL